MNMTSTAGAPSRSECSVPSGSGNVNVGAFVPRGSICDSTAGIGFTRHLDRSSRIANSEFKGFTVEFLAYVLKIATIEA